MKGYRPLFAFGHGLSYTRFALSDLAAAAGRQGDPSQLRNPQRPASAPGKGVAQVYVAPADWKKAGWEAPKRLGAFAKADLKPGQSKSIELAVDPRLLATYEAAGNNWHIEAGDYDVWVGQASDSPAQSVRVSLPDATWSAAIDEK